MAACPLSLYPHHFAISFLILVISTSSHVRFFNAQGRKLAHTPENPKLRKAPNLQSLKEEKATWRAQIGSKPPRCDRRCGSCGHCEAVQVPTNPQITAAIRDEGSSNYKPMSWKCKCGNLVFNP